MRVYNTYTCVQEKCAHTHLHHDGHEQLNGQLERGRVARGAVAQQRDAQRLAQVQREHRAHVLPAVLRIVQYLDQQLQRQQLALRARHTPHAAAAYCVTDAASTRKGRALGRASAQPVCVCVCVCVWRNERAVQAGVAPGDALHSCCWGMHCACDFPAGRMRGHARHTNGRCMVHIGAHSRGEVVLAAGQQGSKAYRHTHKPVSTRGYQQQAPTP